MNADALLESPPVPVPELELVHAAIAKATTAIPPTDEVPTQLERDFIHSA
jgi:hypothetical protein